MKIFIHIRNILILLFIYMSFSGPLAAMELVADRAKQDEITRLKLIAKSLESMESFPTAVERALLYLIERIPAHDPSKGFDKDWGRNPTAEEKQVLLEMLRDFTQNYPNIDWYFDREMGTSLDQLFIAFRNDHRVKGNEIDHRLLRFKDRIYASNVLHTAKAQGKIIDFDGRTLAEHPWESVLKYLQLVDFNEDDFSDLLRRRAQYLSGEMPLFVYIQFEYENLIRNTYDGHVNVLEIIESGDYGLAKYWLKTRDGYQSQELFSRLTEFVEARPMEPINRLIVELLSDERLRSELKASLSKETSLTYTLSVLIVYASPKSVSLIIDLFDDEDFQRFKASIIKELKVRYSRIIRYQDEAVLLKSICDRFGQTFDGFVGSLMLKEEPQFKIAMSHDNLSRVIEQNSNNPFREFDGVGIEEGNQQSLLSSNLSCERFFDAKDYHICRQMLGRSGQKLGEKLTWLFTLASDLESSLLSSILDLVANCKGLTVEKVGRTLQLTEFSRRAFHSGDYGIMQTLVRRITADMAQIIGYDNPEKVISEIRMLVEETQITSSLFLTFCVAAINYNATQNDVI